MDFCFLAAMLFIFRLNKSNRLAKKRGLTGDWGLQSSPLTLRPCARQPRDFTRVGGPQSQYTESGGDQEGHLELVPSERGVPKPWWAVGRSHTDLPPALNGNF